MLVGGVSAPAAGGSTGTGLAAAVFLDIPSGVRDPYRREEHKGDSEIAKIAETAKDCQNWKAVHGVAIVLL